MAEIVLNHDDIRDPQTITEVTRNAFKEKGLNIHVNEVESIDDDFKIGKRHLKVKNTKYHFIGKVPWK
jgi:hypothetical protein